jgi:YidC/Oxa1 family membrane protein insertase
VDRNTVIALLVTAALYFVWQYSLDRRYPNREQRPTSPTATEEVASRPTQTAAAVPPPMEAPAVAMAEAPVAREAEERVVVERPLYTAMLSSYGGALREWVLREYDDATQPGHPAISITSEPIEPSLATPFAELGLGDLSLTPYAVRRPDENTVEFQAEWGGGIRVRKTYRFEPDGYGARLSIEVHNGTAAPIQPEFGVTWPATRGIGADYSQFEVAVYAADEVQRFAVAPLPSMLGFGGGAADEETVIQPEASAPFALDWAGADTRYFLAALLPDKPADARARFTPVEPGSKGRLDVWFAPVSLPAGMTLTRDYRLYLGPKEPDRLDTYGSHLDEAIQKGWAPSLTRFFTGALTFVHGFVPNYGLAILLLTIVIRLAMAPLMVGQMRSMKRMADIAPKVKAAQERFPNDRQKQQEAMMAVYQQEGVSPFSMFGGCLPMLLQLPIFVGFYFALQSSIQLRQQPFFGWIQDLAQPESLFVIPGIDFPVRVLPLLLGGAMVLQQRLTPTPNMDPAQARMMQIVMPLLMTVMFYQFASGLGLYWLTSTLLGIGQQLWMNRSKTPKAA